MPQLGLYQAGACLLSEATSDGKIKVLLGARCQSASQKGRNGLPAGGKGPGQTQGAEPRAKAQTLSAGWRSRGSPPGWSWDPGQQSTVGSNTLTVMQWAPGQWVHLKVGICSFG